LRPLGFQEEEGRWQLEVGVGPPLPYVRVRRELLEAVEIPAAGGWAHEEDRQFLLTWLAIEETAVAPALGVAGPVPGSDPLDPERPTAELQAKLLHLRRRHAWRLPEEDPGDAGAPALRALLAAWYGLLCGPEAGSLTPRRNPQE
jgi:hypothetical protein